ncbi:alpha/beta hydrolase family protein [Sphingomonas sp.]|uniref:alpha/beta hydrolase family protein n=1 Tax=Sphingomonas sp. TaxID=28214 RepID=UPI003B3BD2CF
MGVGRPLHAALIAVLLPASLAAQTRPPVDPARARIEAASQAERARELDLLGIHSLRPTVSARDPHAPDFANFDEAKASPFPDLPPLLTAQNGRDVTSPALWWKLRRPEIARLIDAHLYGVQPQHLPRVRWRVTGTARDVVGGVQVETRTLVGHVDNRAAPAINVDIAMTVTVPVAARGRHVPAVMLFGSTDPHPRPLSAFGISEPAGPSEREQIIARGWAVVVLDPGSVQADNAAGLTQGIIGLANQGRPRSLSDWGALRAWAWGAGRGLDYLATDPDIDARRVAIFGHSRYGKAALVTLAYDQRFAIGYISSSGAGGATLYQRNYGEGIPNLAAANEFHWFAGNFLKLAAVGHSAADLPVDAHELIAMVAPRPLFIGGGVLMLSPPSAVPGDAWTDTPGMFKAAVAASPAWTLLGRRGLETQSLPPVGVYLGVGDIGFRQHEYGHTPKPNWPYFLRFAARYFDRADGPVREHP